MQGAMLSHWRTDALIQGLGPATRLRTVRDGLDSSIDALFELADVFELPRKRRISPTWLREEGECQV